MGFQFRSSVRIAKGVRLNFGKRGSSLSVGGLNLSGRGVTSGFSIPGTGISYRAPLVSLPSPRQRERASRQALRTLEQAEKDLRKLETLQERAAALAKTTASLQEDGSVILTDANGNELSSSEMKMAWEQQGETLTQWLLDEAKRIEDNELIGGIHLDTPNPVEAKPYEVVPFPEPAPTPPLCAEFRGTEPQPTHVAPLGLLSRLSRSRRDAHAAEAATQEEQYRRAMEAWHAARREHEREQDEAFAAYRSARSAWEQQQREHEERERELARNYPTLIRLDADFMARKLEQALERLAWPRETEVRIGFADEGRTVVLGA